MTTLHVMIGLPCSGKTTYAKKLALEAHALRLTPDEWQVRLTASNAILPGHNALHNQIEAIMWEVAETALSLGTSVILDFGLWAKEERDDFRQRAQRLGVGFQPHFMDIPRQELFRRLHQRNQEAPSGVFHIPDAEMESYITLFQPPTAQELQGIPAPGLSDPAMG